MDRSIQIMHRLQLRGSVMTSCQGLLQLLAVNNMHLKKEGRTTRFNSLQLMRIQGHMPFTQYLISYQQFCNQH